MPLNQAEMARLAEVAITAFDMGDAKDNINTGRPLLDELMKNPEKLEVGKEGFTRNIYIDNGANTQDVSGNATVTYNIRDNNRRGLFDFSFVHDGFTLSEEELFRSGIAVTDKSGLSGATTKLERVQLVNSIKQKLYALKQGQMSGIHSRLWLDGSQGADRKQGIDALVSLTPTAGVIGGLPASAAYWQNGASTGVAATFAVFSSAVAQLNRNATKRRGKITHYFAGGDLIDSMRSQALTANVTNINYEGGGMVRYDYAHDTIMINGKPVIHVPDFDDNFGLAAPTVPWSKRLYALNLGDCIKLHKDSDFLNARDAGRPIDQYTYYMGMTSKFGISIDQRNSNWVLSIA